MALPRDIIIRRLRRVISSFKFEDIEEAVLPNFPELTWHKLRKSLLKNNLGLTVSGSVNIIENMIKDKQIASKELMNRLLNLELVATSRDSARREWTCYELRGRRTSTGLESDQEIQEKIASSFARGSQQMDVRVTTHNSITFVSVKSKKQLHRAGQSTYYAFSNEQNYFFTSRKSIAKDYLIAVTRGLGYADSKLAKLSGRDLKSLLKLLWAKQQGAINYNSVDKPPAYNGSKPVVRRTGIDFTESKQRGEYVDKYFGPEPAQTELLDITITKARWKHADSVSESDDKAFDMKVEFRSNHIPKMIKEFVERRVVLLPLPAYAVEMMTIGKNELTLRSEP